MRAGGDIGNDAISASEGYDRIAASFDAERGPKPWEWRFFEELSQSLRPGDRLLDCGCGSGHLGLRSLVERGIEITALDGSAAMLALFRQRYPTPSTLLCDMRAFRPAKTFEAIVAWDSFFHLGHDDQATMIGRFSAWLHPEGRLLFTSGPDHSTVSGEMFEVGFSYSSFDDAEYRALLADNGFVAVRSEFDEPTTRIHKVWNAERSGSGG